ncbi:MAG: class I SAM-dependent methyltransferase [Isosphaeraceae bacterium]|nr:class I SAM-dependent methyltransferase [Isosphaeraceae bacterium]
MLITLKNREELDACRRRLRDRGLDFSTPDALGFWRWPYRLRYRIPLPTADTLKSWDVAHAVEEIERFALDRATPILDMGCFNSEVVYVLHRLGYTEIHGCDLNPSCRWMPFFPSIRYRLADLTKTPYADRSMGVITCLSVVEHGVPIEPFVDEVARLLRPGGLFLFTTDYDATGAPHEIPPGTRLFGQPWTLFDPKSLQALIDRFLAKGFTLARPELNDPHHEERPVLWEGQNYTFVMVGLRAPGLASRS